TDAAYVDDNGRCVFGKQGAAEMRNHSGRIVTLNHKDTKDTKFKFNLCLRAFVVSKVILTPTGSLDEVREDIRTNNQPVECLPSLPQCASRRGNQDRLVAGA